MSTADFLNTMGAGAEMLMKALQMKQQVEQQYAKMAQELRQERQLMEQREQTIKLQEQQLQLQQMQEQRLTVKDQAERLKGAGGEAASPTRAAQVEKLGEDKAHKEAQKAAITRPVATYEGVQESKEERARLSMLEAGALTHEIEEAKRDFSQLQQNRILLDKTPGGPEQLKKAGLRVESATGEAAARANFILQNGDRIADTVRAQYQVMTGADPDAALRSEVNLQFNNWYPAVKALEKMAPTEQASGAALIMSKYFGAVPPKDRNRVIDLMTEQLKAFETKSSEPASK